MHNKPLIKGSAMDRWADRVIKDARGNMNMGIDPVVQTAYTIKGAALIKRSQRSESIAIEDGGARSLPMTSFPCLNQRILQELTGLMLLVAVMVAQSAFGQSKTWPCLDGEGDDIFRTSASAPLAAVRAGRIPALKFDGAGKPQSLAWIERPSAPAPDVKVLGEAAGRAVFQVTYPMTPPDEREFGPAPFACVMLAFAEPIKDSEAELRPFYVKSGDQIRSWEASWKREGGVNSIEVRSTLKGNGVYWSNYDFAITPEGPRLTGITSGGRKMKTTHREFDADGRVIKTSVIEGN